MGGAILGLVALGSIRKHIEQARGSKTVSSIPPRPPHLPTSAAAEVCTFHKDPLCWGTNLLRLPGDLGRLPFVLEAFGALVIYRRGTVILINTWRKPHLRPMQGWTPWFDLFCNDFRLPRFSFTLGLANPAPCISCCSHSSL